MLHHVTREIPPSALEPCIRFYRILGFEQVPAPPGIAGRAVWLERTGDGSPPPQVHLMPANDPAPPGGHFALVCRAYDETLEQLRDAGHEVDPRKQHWGSPRAYVRDPAGGLIELMESPPGEQRG